MLTAKIITKFSSVTFQLSRELSKVEGDGSKNVTLTADFVFFKLFHNSFLPAAFKWQIEINLSKLNSWGPRSICRLSALSVLKVIAPAGKAKSRGGTLVTRAYIKESTYSCNIQSYSQYRKNLDFLEQGPRGIGR